MSSSYYGDAVVSTGEYQDQQGQTKKRWTKVGAMFRDTENGNISIKFDVLPMPKDGECWVKIFKKEDKPPQQNIDQVLNPRATTPTYQQPEAAPPQAVAPPVMPEMQAGTLEEPPF